MPKTALAMLLAASLLAGCQTTRGTGPTGEARFCRVVIDPLTYDSRTDSPATIDQIRRLNAAWDELCGGSQ